jgi:hypothetical protein
MTNQQRRADDEQFPAPAEKPAPIEFHALDKAHAKTAVDKHLGISDETKAALQAALDTVTHQGPVHVAVPAPPLTPGAHKPHKDDPTHPADGSFAVKPFHFVKV